ncbi:MAG: rod shape-determining protein MreD [Patescibacteria group bacterium]|nr:rod shape-determining protein MreD [Patescibacteria group bacterium]
MINGKIKNYIFIPLLIVFLILQITFIPQYFPDNFIPNIVLMLLLAGSVINNKSSNIFYFAFFCGFIFDVFSGGYFGTALVIILISVFVSYYLSHILLKELFSYNLLLISTFSILVYNIISIFLVSINDFQQVFYNAEQFFFIIIFQIVCMLVLIYPLTYIIFSKNEK